MKEFKGGVQWGISEPDKVKRRVISGDIPTDHSEWIWSRRFLMIAFMFLFAISFLACLVYGMTTTNFRPLGIVWEYFAPVTGFILGFFFTPH